MTTALVLVLVLTAPSEQMVTGTVRDTTGRGIVAAAVVLHGTDGSTLRTMTDAEGRFTLPRPGGVITLHVAATGFHPLTRPVGAADMTLEVELTPALDAAVTVTAGRLEQKLMDVAATVSVVERTELDRSPAMTPDDVLRQVPAFSLFRRSSSVAAHPTAQGVSLRGIGPSGVSRTLVLVDGIPFNDPFGGWVSWTRVPQSAVERIEIVEGSGGTLFGNASMGGVVNILTRQPRGSRVDMTLQYGERQTPRLDASVSGRAGRWTGLLDGGVLRTDGYPVVVESERGIVDENVAAAAGRLYGSLGYQRSPATSLYTRVDVFDESRQNGKRSTIDRTPEQNDTQWISARAGTRTTVADGELRADLFGDRVRFRSNFLAVPTAMPPRSIGRMTLNQYVPSSNIGFAAQWSRPTRWAFVTAGLDWRNVEGNSREDVLDAQTGTTVTLLRRSGGAQNNLGLFAQGVLTPVSPLVVTLALRHDRWTNLDGHNLETTPDGTPTANDRPSLPDASDRVTTPRASAVLKVTSHAGLWTSIGWGFRAPTLNELYRQFRVGQVTTLANESLGPERLRSVEAGVRLAPHPSVLVRGAWFDNTLRDAVSNVTVSTSAAGTIQRRQNLGLTRVRGVQTDLEWRQSDRAQLSAAYIYNNALVREFESNPALVGKVLPQVPRHRGTVQLFVSHPRLADVTVAVQAAGRQFDDDLNVRTVPGASEPGLPGFVTVDVMLSRRAARGFSFFLGGQNLFDERAYAGTLPTTLAAPRTLSVGLRWQPSLSR